MASSACTRPAAAVAHISCSLKVQEARNARGLRLPARREGRTSRRQLRTQAILSELDLPALVSGLQDALPHLPSAASAASSTFTSAHPSLPTSQLSQLLTLADAAAQRIAELADAAVATMGAEGGEAAATAAAAPKDNGWLQPLVTGLETVLSFIQTGLDKLNVPYSYGWSIVALTALIKLATFPLTKKQVESALNVQRLKPQIDIIKAQYGDNKDAISRETNELYKKAGVDPLAGCLPSIATIPIFIGLYRSLSDFASLDEATTAAFYWIPSLAGPTSVAAQRAGSGTAWLFPLVDGAPPIGWDLAARYLALPLALVVAQYISNAIITPPQTDDSGAAKFSANLVKVLPLMIGWFALNVPSGLSLYYFSNTVLTATQQVYLKKLGGASLAEYDLGPIELGKARRTGTAAAILAEGTEAATQEAAAGAVAENGAAMTAATTTDTAGEADASQAALAAAAAAAPAVPQISRRCKRRRRELLESTA